MITNDPVAYFDRGIAFQAQNKLDEAIKDYTKAIQLDPNYDTAYYNRGMALQAQNKLDEAFKDQSKAIQLEPNDPLYLSNIINQLFKTLIQYRWKN